MLSSTTPSESETEMSSVSLETTLTNAGQTVVSGENAEFFRETVDTSESESSRTQWSSPANLASPVPRTVAQIHGARNRPTADHEPSEVPPDGAGLHAAQAVAPVIGHQCGQQQKQCLKPFGHRTQ